MARNFDIDSVAERDDGYVNYTVSYEYYDRHFLQWETGYVTIVEGEQATDQEVLSQAGELVAQYGEDGEINTP
jgi:hypothetical protein